MRRALTLWLAPVFYCACFIYLNQREWDGHIKVTIQTSCYVMSIQSCCNNNKIHVGLLLLYSFNNVNNCYYQLSEEKLKQWAAQKTNKINTTCFTPTLLLKFISFCCQATCFLTVNSPNNHLQPIRAKVCLVRYFSLTLPGYFNKPTDFSDTWRKQMFFNWRTVQWAPQEN